MNPCELTASITALANMIAADLQDEELDVASAIFMQLGDTLDTISAQRALCRKIRETEDRMNCCGENS